MLKEHSRIQRQAPRVKKTFNFRDYVKATPVGCWREIKENSVRGGGQKDSYSIKYRRAEGGGGGGGEGR